ncbi:MAG: hypothetical protein KIT11_08610 [Fimbriimonadaceae bacterium]|nr:hypothetical protein [Fimbriimonadaceae bacterium]QYK56414.1 MAG: hypothetical protein KF733_02805 [Fimbriimonadaceae bacterium]
MKASRFDRTFVSAGAVLLVIGIVLALLGSTMGGRSGVEIANSYYFAWHCWTALTLGCLGLSLLHHATRGHWGFPLVRLFEAGSGPFALGVTFIGWLGVAAQSAAIYPWANPSVVAGDPILTHRAGAMNFSFWVARGIVYFLVFFFFSMRNQATLREEERTGRSNWQARSRFSAVGLVVYFLLVTLAWTDWGMSRELHWYSTMYGFWNIIGGALMAMSLAVAVACFNSEGKPYRDVMAEWLSRDWGNLLLTMTLLWAYFSFSQYLIIWSGNLPVTTEYFIARTDGGWLIVSNILLFFQFFVPFVLLLMPGVKKSPKTLGTIAAYIFAMRLVDWFWITVPTFRPQLGVHALDLGALFALGGLWFLAYGLSLQRAPLLTSREARIVEATENV